MLHKNAQMENKLKETDAFDIREIKQVCFYFKFRHFFIILSYFSSANFKNTFIFLSLFCAASFVNYFYFGSTSRYL